MSRRNEPRLDLKLNLSPPPRVSTNSSTNHPRATTNHVDPYNSPPSSCVSSDMSANHQDEAWRGSSLSPESSSSMMLVGCPRCLMYVMVLSEEDQRCPKCKSTVLLDFNANNDDNNVNNGGSKKARKV